MRDRVMMTEGIKKKPNTERMRGNQDRIVTAFMLKGVATSPEQDQYNKLNREVFMAVLISADQHRNGINVQICNMELCNANCGCCLNPLY